MIILRWFHNKRFRFWFLFNTITFSCLSWWDQINLFFTNELNHFIYCFIYINLSQNHILSDEPILFKCYFLLCCYDYEGRRFISLLIVFVLQRGKTTLDYNLNCCFKRSTISFLLFYLSGFNVSYGFFLDFLYWLFILSILNFRYAN